MPRIVKLELLIIEMVAEFVAEGAQECSERGDLLPHCRPHPHADQHGLGAVVPEKLGCPSFANSQGSGCKDAYSASRNSVEPRCGGQDRFNTDDAPPDERDKSSSRFPNHTALPCGRADHYQVPIPVAGALRERSLPEDASRIERGECPFLHLAKASRCVAAYCRKFTTQRFFSQVRIFSKLGISKCRRTTVLSGLREEAMEANLLFCRLD